MCGILGAYDVGARDDPCVAVVSEAIVHRGPVAVGAWRGPGDPSRARLEHRRLANQTTGDSLAHKKLFGVTADGQVARLHNFQRTELWRDDRRSLTSRRVEAAEGGAAE